MLDHIDRITNGAQQSSGSDSTTLATEERTPNTGLFSTSIRALNLSVRPYNALKRQGLTTLRDALLVVKQFRESGDIPVRNLGRKSIAEIEQKIDAYFAQHQANQQSVYADTASKATPQADSSNAPRKTLQDLRTVIANEIHCGRLSKEAVFLGYTLQYWLQHDFSDKSIRWLTYACRSLENALSFETVCEEMISLLDNIPASNLEIFVRRSLTERPTLEELGQERKVTRERIRQIEYRTRRRIALRLPNSPCLRIQSAIVAAKEMGVRITHSAWVEQVTKSGLLGRWRPGNSDLSSVTPLDLMLAICSLAEAETASAHFVLPGNLRLITGDESVSAYVVETLRQLPRQTVRDIRKQAKNGGAVYIPLISEELGVSDEETRSLLSHLEYEHVTDDWYMLRARETQIGFDRTWAFVHTVLKMLQFCGPLTIEQICRGARRHASRKGHTVAPPDVLSQILTRYHFVIDDGYITWHHDNPSTASASEMVALRVIEQLGPVVSHFELVQAFIDAGLSIPSLSSVLRYSPLFVKVDFGLYKLRGKAVSQGDTERTRLRQPVTDANAEIAFDTSGAIRLKLNLGSIAIASGVIYTTRLPILTGRWAVYVNRAMCGSLTVRDKQIWSLMKPFRLIKAQIGDRVELKFDTWEHVVHVAKVNDESQ
jgi:hypothetical protein